MLTDREQIVAKLHGDHDYMNRLMHRIASSCAQRGATASCGDCRSLRRGVCRENIERLIAAFVEVTLRHHLVESTFMGDDIPREHRIAHQRAHMEIAEQLKSIRLVYSAEGDGIVALDGIEGVLGLLSAHLTEYDEPLERYLLAA